MKEFFNNINIKLYKANLCNCYDIYIFSNIIFVLCITSVSGYCYSYKHSKKTNVLEMIFINCTYVYFCTSKMHIFFH